jgi:hypothetical protein
MDIELPALSLTPRFSEVPKARVETVNRFSGFAQPGKFRRDLETAEAVHISSPVYNTPLKRGVNESCSSHNQTCSRQ